MPSALDKIDPEWAWQPFVPVKGRSGIEGWRLIYTAALTYRPKSTRLSSKVLHLLSTRLCTRRMIRAISASKAMNWRIPFWQPVTPCSSPPGGFMSCLMRPSTSGADDAFGMDILPRVPKKWPMLP